MTYVHLFQMHKKQYVFIHYRLLMSSQLKVRQQLQGYRNIT